MLEYKRARFAARLPTDYLYSPSHFWLARREEDLWRVGLTKFGTRRLGEMVEHGFGVELNARVTLGQVIGWVEGFKAISDLHCLVEGRFAGGNPALQTEITLINKDPHGAGWLYAVKGRPDTKCVGVEGYVRILDQTIDRLLASRASEREGIVAIATLSRSHALTPHALTLHAKHSDLGICFCTSPYRSFITLAAARTVCSMSAAEWAVERKPASNCEGAR